MQYVTSVYTNKHFLEHYKVMDVAIKAEQHQERCLNEWFYIQNWVLWNGLF